MSKIVHNRAAPPDPSNLSDTGTEQAQADFDGSHASLWLDAEAASPDTVDYSDQRNFAHQGLLDRFRVQLPIAVLFAVLVQLIYGQVLLGVPLGESPARNAIVTTLIANTISMLNYRQLRLFPGARRFAFLLPAFLPVYGISALLLLWLRLPYSLSLILVGFATCIGLAAVFNVFVRSAKRTPLLMIPSPKVTALLNELPRISHSMCVDPSVITRSKATVVADLHADLSPEWERAIAAAALNGSTIYHVKHLRESLTGRVRIDHLSENSVGTLKPNEFYFFFKSAIERLVSTIALIPALPIIAVAGLAIKLESPGGAIFRQTRVGFRGKQFTIYKLRTMVQPSVSSGEREDAITKANDPRITRLGRFLRKTRIDELPQLWNVIRGDLSLIGPRPEAVPLSEWYYQQLDFYAYRHIIRPGITGWAQVNQGHVADPTAVGAKLQYDFYYIKNYSLWLDALIILKTVGVVFSGRGAR
ncbi:sugar transferase [Erythrobacter sp. LQ02-29]|uniref:sugar transferase n=1 Tax=Erythrobacter sp. LQ02-29 TaxID=2920384 RepID=UPI001F4D5286|nr:sugar transferase [Erythrobacter sp. LQ02-29]